MCPRPDHRWLILGVARSGSSFHIDPNGTSAWNAVLSGKKKWILFPPGEAPPGVIGTDDGSHVTCPISVVEWFETYYSLSTQRHPYECVVEAGEMIFVPPGWWHIVLNITDSIAVTQNFVSDVSLPHVMAFLRDRPEQVSGWEGNEDLYTAMKKAVPSSYTELKVPKVVSKKQDAAEKPFQFQFQI